MILLAGAIRLFITAAILLFLSKVIIMENMIYAENLRKEFKKIIKEPGIKGSVKALFKPHKEIVTAVDDISFAVPKGEILGFIGPNGAGKSTVIKMLTGILMPTSGKCVINGQIPQKNRKDYVREIGVVFGQRTQLWWDLALRETYAVLKEIYEVPDDRYKKRMAFLNEVLELDSFITSPVRTLSLGQRMRADIAASLLGIVIASPIMLVTAAAIRLYDRGPAIYFIVSTLFPKPDEDGMCMCPPHKLTLKPQPPKRWDL